MFQYDENKTPRMWTAKENIPLIARDARLAAANVLAQLAVIRPATTPREPLVIQPTTTPHEPLVIQPVTTPREPVVIQPSTTLREHLGTQYAWRGEETSGGSGVEGSPP